MNTLEAAQDDPGLTLGGSATVAGLGLLVMTIAAPFAEFSVYSKLVVTGEIEATIQNLRVNGGLLLGGIFAYLTVFILDVIVAWALYVLLAPVNRSLSLLTAWFRLVYTAIALFALLELVAVYRLLHMPDGIAAPASRDLPFLVGEHLGAFRFEWGFGLILFGIHLLLLAYLVYRSGYMPRILGILLGIAGASWIVYELAPYLLPGADFGFLMIGFAGEIVFMLWLLVRGRAIRAH